MALRLPEAQDTELNMTPMIDIVFQLIIFFLLSLKFKNIDRRIDTALPRDSGPVSTPVFPPDLNMIKVKVFRRDVGRDTEHTMIKVGNGREAILLPKSWKGHSKELAAGNTSRLEAYERGIEAAHSRIRDLLGSEDPAKARGEIVASRPRGGAVPHGDVMAVLNVFLQQGITDVRFEGAPTPLTRRERANLGR